MKDRFRRSPRLLGFATIALLVAGGVAGAAIPDSDDSEIHACYQKNQGQLRVIDAQEGGTCRESELSLVFNQQGPQGDTGPRGPSDGFSRFHDAETEVTNFDAARLLELEVPVGKYVTTGTVIVRNTGPAGSFVTCVTRHPSGDFDLAQTRLAPSGQPGDTQTLAMNPVGFATSPGAIWMDCSDGGGDVVASWMKISSTQVATLTNTPG